MASGFANLYSKNNCETIKSLPFGIALDDDDDDLVEKHLNPERPDQPHGCWSTEALPLDFRCIDVLEECGAKVPHNCPYVALSYVWGLSSAKQNRASLNSVSELSSPDDPS